MKIKIRIFEFNIGIFDYFIYLLNQTCLYNKLIKLNDMFPIKIYFHDDFLDSF